jgi:4-carboxymuconolactone decarboxylase
MTSEARLPRWKREDLDPEQQALYDAFVGGPRQSQAGFFPVADSEGVLSGPYRAMLLSPALGAPFERVGRAVRYESALSARLRELVILVVAALTESEVEWRAHEALALSEGVPEETVASLRSASPVFVDDLDQLVHDFVRALLVDHAVTDERFDEVQALVGHGGVFELVATAGYYQFIAHVNNAFGLRP